MDVPPNVEKSLSTMRKKPIIKAIDTGASDKRTKGSTQKAVKGLSKFKPSEIAKSLGISTQKWTGIKKQVQSGKLYNSKLRDIFVKVKEKFTGKKQKESAEQKAFREDAGLSKKEFEKQAAKLKKEMRAEKKRAKEINEEGEVKNNKMWASTTNGNTYADNLKEAKRYYKHLREVKKMPTLKQADTWLKKIGGAGREYFAIVREKTARGQTIYKIYDTRSPKERARRQNAKGGKDSGLHRAQEIKKGGK